MKNQNFYSPSTGGFYNSAEKDVFDNSAAGWPSDAIPVSDDDYNYLLQGQEEGKIILPGSDGNPVLSDPKIDWLSTAMAKKTALLAEASEMVSDWKTELQLNIISEADKLSLSAWMEYIRDVKSVDVSDINSEGSFKKIKWPATPSI